MIPSAIYGAKMNIEIAKMIINENMGFSPLFINY